MSAPKKHIKNEYRVYLDVQGKGIRNNIIINFLQSIRLKKFWYSTDSRIHPNPTASEQM